MEIFRACIEQTFIDTSKRRKHGNFHSVILSQRVSSASRVTNKHAGTHSQMLVDQKLLFFSFSLSLSRSQLEELNQISSAHQNKKWPDRPRLAAEAHIQASTLRTEQSRVLGASRLVSIFTTHMAQIDSIRAVLYSKNIDASNVKPYTGLHLNATGNGRQVFPTERNIFSSSFKEI